jgi:phosphopantetheinyl transferase (holo-ACP synthase)
LLVGNDVVDLHEPENQPDAIHPRFDERVFSSDERACLGIESTAHATRWRMWAAKESAFKVARKLDAGARFLPRQFSVHFTGRSRAVVRHAVGHFDIALSGPEGWIHAVATPALNAGTWVAPHVLVERASDGLLAAREASSRVRAMAVSALESAFSIDRGDIVIVSAGRIPLALWKESPLPVDLSFSHHGRLVACVWSRTA